MSLKSRAAGLWQRGRGAAHLDEVQDLRSRLARLTDSVEENSRLRPELEDRFASLAQDVVGLAERRTTRDR